MTDAADPTIAEAVRSLDDADTALSDAGRFLLLVAHPAHAGGDVVRDRARVAARLVEGLRGEIKALAGRLLDG